MAATSNYGYFMVFQHFRVNNFVFHKRQDWPTCPASSPKYLAPAAENKFPVPSCFAYCLCQVLTTQQQCRDQVAPHPSQAPSLFPCLVALKGRNPPIGMLQLPRYSQRSATHSPLFGKILQEIDRTLPSYSFSTQFPVVKVLKLWTTGEVFEVGRNAPEKVKVWRNWKTCRKV